MNTTSAGLDLLNAALPDGYRMREFADGDQKPLVAERNALLPEMQRGDADEWREWERVDPPKDELRITLVAPDGSVAGGASVGPRRMGDSGDGTLSGQVQVFRAHARRGIASARLRVIEGEAGQTQGAADPLRRQLGGLGRARVGRRNEAAGRSGGTSSHTSTLGPLIRRRSRASSIASRPPASICRPSRSGSRVWTRQVVTRSGGRPGKPRRRCGTTSRGPRRHRTGRTSGSTGSRSRAARRS